ncbi:hypothetical protein [Arthrobacter globiformis]|uniref:hypothetical protein n=1 Tax=Arthrobacter globiformis TaxID=1665 RepID=UPI002794A0EA|nr:hypothetical protein [Arthrobacter globiformis]MDQ0618260.1 hypothetical protein [Arthrobacter globiformis]
MLGFLSNLRDVKSALSAGMLLLFAGWLLLGDEVARVRPTDETLAGRVAILVDYIGPVATLAVLPFVAYVIGLIVPLHFVGQWIIASRNRRQQENDEDSQGSPLQDFILSQIKRAAREKSVREMLGQLNREVPGFVKMRISYPVWMLLFPRRIRQRIKHLWGRRLVVHALEDHSGDEEAKNDKVTTRDGGAASTVERKEEEMLANIVLLRVRRRRALMAAALAQADSGAYERFDKAQSESDFRAGLCVPLLILTIVTALQIPLDYQTWQESPVLAILWLASGAAAAFGIGWGVVKQLEIRTRAVAAFAVGWGAVGAPGVFGVPWGPVGVLAAGCLAVLVLALWASHKGAEAQAELDNAIILGHIGVLELKVLGTSETLIPNLRTRLWNALRANQ